MAQPASSSLPSSGPPPSSLQVYLRLLGYVRPYWKAFAVAIGAMAVTASTEPLLPIIMKPILDRTFVEKDVGFMQWVPVLVIGLFFVRGVSSFVADYCTHWTSHKVVLDLRRQMFATVLRLPASHYDDTTTGQLISKFTYDTLQVTAAATSALAVIVKDTLVILGLLGFLFWSNWKLTLITLTVGPLIALIVRQFSARLRRTNRMQQEAMGELNHALEEAIGGQKVVKVFDGQHYEAERFGKAADRVRRFQMKSVAAAAANVPLTQIAASFAVAIIMAMAFRQALSDQTTVGGFVAFLGAMLMLLAPLKRLANVSQSLQSGLAACESVFALIDARREEDRGTRTLPPLEQGAGRGRRIEFDRIRFKYPAAEREALAGIDLVIAAGETVALVGASGSGKTTLANLIPRFYLPGAGHIRIDGVDTGELALADLRANIALVSQDVVLFNDTVAANIAYGRLAAASRDAVERAARAAHAGDFIRAMPQGFDTVVGENGVRLSGGQRQRLAIARAFLKDAPILILDEATSALDSESERNVQAALEELMLGRTTIVIAHRLSTIERADRIVVMQDGRIAEMGSHAELIARDGVYARLHRLATERRSEEQPA